MKSRIWFVAVVCLMLSGVVMARALDVSPCPSQMIMLDDPNEPVDTPE